MIFREGHVAVAEQLLLHGADVELPDNYGQSPLFMACWKGRRHLKLVSNKEVLLSGSKFMLEYKLSIPSRNLCQVV